MSTRVLSVRAWFVHDIYYISLMYIRSSDLTGWQRIHPGDAIVRRSILSNGDPLEDTLEMIAGLP